ncbi:unnamed protein product, partial [Nesidiocoris tenuis]
NYHPFHGLLPFGVEHFHEKRLRRGASAAMLQVQMLFPSRRQMVDFGQDLQDFVELVL